MAFLKPDLKEKRCFDISELTPRGDFQNKTLIFIHDYFNEYLRSQLVLQAKFLIYELKFDLQSAVTRSDATTKTIRKTPASTEEICMMSWDHVVF